ncbi:MAG: hydrogenase maturation protease [Thermodesulfovibrionales bacterium]|nr:hydrogenase maturation protease [Thermodesulfovibrionales bacterium]
MEINTPVALVGYGNTLRGDDGAGIEAARLTKTLSKGLPITLFEYQQLTIDLACILKEFEKIVFFDCSINIPYGTYLISPLTMRLDTPHSMSHHIIPSDLLFCIKTLYGKEPEGLLCQIGGKDFEYGASLKGEILNAIRECANKVVQILKMT